MVMKMIIETGNRNLFPELNIPRTTINYWLSKSRAKVSSKRDIVYEARIKNQEKELFKLKAKNSLIKNCLVKLLERRDTFDKRSMKDKEFLINIIDDYKEFLSLKDTLEVIGISHSTYYRWRVQVLGCKYNDHSKCNVVRANSLTQEEQELMIKYATSKSFRKFSTVSLMYYCRRTNLLNISLDSWYKYLTLYGVVRNNFKLNPLRKYKEGIRAKKVWN